MRLLRGFALAVLAAQPAAAGSILFATAATPGRVDGFCLARDGALAPAPKVRSDTAGTQPRRLLVGNGVLYVAEVDRVEAFRIGRRGGLTPLGSTTPLTGMNPIDLALSPDGKMLYVPQNAPDRVVAYPLGDDGAPGKEFTSCIQGRTAAGYQDLLVSGSLLYVSSDTSRIEIFPIGPDGSLQAQPAECRPARSGEDRPPVTTPLSERRKLQRPKAFLIAGDMLYVEERLLRKITAFHLQPDGTFFPPTVTGKKTRQQRPASRTDRILQYEDLVPHRSTLLGAQFFRGRIDAYRLRADGRLPKQPTRTSVADVRLTPVRVRASDDDVLYVAAGEVDRVIAYRLRSSDGVLAARTPFSQTDEQKDSFPNDVAVAALSDQCGD